MIDQRFWTRQNTLFTHLAVRLMLMPEIAEMKRPPHTQPTQPRSKSQELLDRGRLALQAIHYHERAARYKAAAARLQAAMIQAENGHDAKLQEWLESESQSFDVEFELSSLAARKSDDSFELPLNSVSNIASAPQRGGSSNRQTPLNVETELGAETEWDADQEDSRNHLGSGEAKASASISMDNELPEGSVEINHRSAITVSPWSRMEKAAIARLATDNGESDWEDESDKEVADKKVTDKHNIDDEVLTDPDALGEEAGEDSEERVELPMEILVELQELESNSAEHRVKTWWRAPHVWGSVVAHLLLAACLSLIVATVAAEPKLLAVVSAPFEADNVLLETPMEMISELETVVEPMQSVPAPSLSGLAAEIDLGKVPIDSGSSIAAASSSVAAVSSAINGASSEMSQASMAGSKMLSGAEFFGVKATGNTFVYIVDSSPSMRRDGAFDAAKAEIMRSLQSMKPKQRYFISFFGKEIDPMVFQTGVIEKYPIYATPENLTKTIEWLNRVLIQKDGLPPNNALSEAIGMQPDGIFLLFDGDTRSDVAKYLRKANRSDDILSAGMPRVPIHVVHFFQEEFQKQMRLVAEENGGTYRFVPRPDRPFKK